MVAVDEVQRSVGEGQFDVGDHLGVGDGPELLPQPLIVIEIQQRLGGLGRPVHDPDHGGPQLERHGDRAGLGADHREVPGQVIGSAPVDVLVDPDHAFVVVGGGDTADQPGLAVIVDLQPVDVEAGLGGRAEHPLGQHRLQLVATGRQRGLGRIGRPGLHVVRRSGDPEIGPGVVGQVASPGLGRQGVVRR